jgi:hypothetical protein
MVHVVYDDIDRDNIDFDNMAARIDDLFAHPLANLTDFDKGLLSTAKACILKTGKLSEKQINCVPDRLLYNEQKIAKASEVYNYELLEKALTLVIDIAESMGHKLQIVVKD